MARQPYWAKDSPLSRFRDRTQTHHIRLDSSGREDPTARPLDQQLGSMYTKHVRNDIYNKHSFRKALIHARVSRLSRYYSTAFSLLLYVAQLRTVLQR